MAMKLSEFNRLKKMMMMTTSPNDSEALVALRIANKVIAEQGYTWNDVFARLVKVEEPMESMAAVENTPRENSRDDKNQRIKDAFSFLESRGVTSSFLKSIEEQFEDKGWLSQAQQDALFRNEERVRTGR